MIKIANNLNKLIKRSSSTSVGVGVGSGLLGSIAGAGLLHVLADEENKTLLNYLLAAGAGAGVGSGSGLLAYNLADSINFHANNPGATPADAIPGAIKDETEKAEEAKKK